MNNIMKSNSSKDNVEVIIRNLVLSFFKGLQLKLEDSEIRQLNWDLQDKFLNQTIYTRHFKKYPCNKNFSRLFFKNLIHQLEGYHEVHDGMYEYLCSVMENTNTSFSYQHYFIKNDNIITIKQTRNMVLNGTTGLKTWEAALMLADWGLYNEKIFAKKKVLELGSGVGFTGITLAKHCDIGSIIMTDHHPEVLKVINDNILINFQVSSQDLESCSTIYKINQKLIGTMMLDWNNIEDLPQQLIPDIIIGADIVYDPSILKPLINVLNLFNQRNKNVEIYIASVIRNVDTFNEFIAVLESSNFQYEKKDLTKHGNVDWDEDTNRCLLKIRLSEALIMKHKVQEHHRVDVKSFPSHSATNRWPLNV